MAALFISNRTFFVMRGYKAILWDCDGVLIDSEILACASAAEEISDYGYHISTETFIAQFMGKSLSQILSEIDERTSLNLSDRFDRDRLRSRQKDVFNAQLKAMPGVNEALEKISLPIAVASGSEIGRLEHTLSITGLLKYFNGHIYSADMVAKGKPAPDIFLHAAENLGIEPRECLVIEDGIHGIHAAHAAEMDVLVWLGGSHMTDVLRAQVLATQPMGVLEDFSQLISYQ